MSTLYKIRENKINNKQYLESLSKKYTNPLPIDTISCVIKTHNIIYIKKICSNYNLSDKKIEEILKTLIKPNYYTPTIVNSEEKENMQQYL